MTMIEFYRALAASVKPGLEERLDFVRTSNSIYHPFPSVTKGPISIKKLQKAIQFEPSKPIEVFKECVDFYKNAFFKYSKMRQRIERQVKKNFLTEKDTENFINFIKSY